MLWLVGPKLTVAIVATLIIDDIVVIYSILEHGLRSTCV